jgi:hypothetical protein
MRLLNTATIQSNKQQKKLVRTHRNLNENRIVKSADFYAFISVKVSERVYLRSRFVMNYEHVIM